MFRCRYGKFHCSAQFLVFTQAVMLFFGDEFAHQLLRFDGPVEAKTGLIQLIPGHHPQVMHHIAAAHDQHAFFAQRGQFSGQLVVVGWWLLPVEAELNNRNISFGKKVFDHRPGTMIEAPMQIRLHLCCLNQFGAEGCQYRASGRRVVHGVKFRRKAAKIVDCPGLIHGRHESTVCFPMCRNTEDGSRTG